jgi:NAD(P)-dependent dehydrogenase (short-subunit alcohol dehydrogenase family)
LRHRAVQRRAEIGGLSELDWDCLSERPAIPPKSGDPREIAHAIVFLASDESTFDVGSELMIDQTRSDRR